MRVEWGEPNSESAASTLDIHIKKTFQYLSQQLIRNKSKDSI